ncbi:hypothetical protein AcV5_003758 [Taiwanofungus camphoratus]|nr:hypothetical protein AcV5_003758 [Antrodia cinnamomea]KAI0922156.1 hypothetical protein AcW2_006928 [Antrodia cinnamomea]
MLQLLTETPPPMTGPGFVYRRADRLEDTYNYYTVMLPYGSSTMHRADMMDVLRRNLPASCSIHTSKRLDKYTEVTDERGIVTAIELHFTDGSIVETDVLIGADGIKSATRATLYDIAHRKECSQEIDKHSCSRCAMATPKWSGTVAYRCLIPTEKLRQVNPEHQAFGFTLCYSGKGKHVVSYPVSHGSFINFIGFSTLGKEGAAYEGKWVQEMPKEDLVKHYVGWEREVQEMLQCVEESSRWAIHMVISLPFSVSDRVALLGDAMHAMETHLGAGAGQSIEDAYILGRLLAHPLTTLSRVSEVLRIYQSIRLPFAHTIQQRARETGRMCEFNGPGYYGGEECHDERERLAELGEALYRQWKWQWEEPFDEQWELAEKAMGRFARADGQIECV